MPISKLLQEYIRRIVEEKIDVSSSGRPLRLRVFDLDDTLINSDGEVRVLSPDGDYSLTPAEFAAHIPKQGEKYDFSEFTTLVRPRVIKLTYQIFMNVYRKWGAGGVVILTARGPSAKDAISKFLDSVGAPGVEVVTVGTDNGAAPNPHDKSEWIRQRIDADGLNYVEFFDDSDRNVDAVARLQGDYDPSNVKIISRQVLKGPRGATTTRSWRPGPTSTKRPPKDQ